MNIEKKSDYLNNTHVKKLYTNRIIIIPTQLFLFSLSKTFFENYARGSFLAYIKNYFLPFFLMLQNNYLQSPPKNCQKKVMNSLD